MIPEALDKSIEAVKAEGKVNYGLCCKTFFLARQVPFFVNATSGSTVLGAYDDLEALAEVCSKHKVIRFDNSKDLFNLA